MEDKNFEEVEVLTHQLAQSVYPLLRRKHKANVMNALVVLVGTIIIEAHKEDKNENLISEIAKIVGNGIIELVETYKGEK